LSAVRELATARLLLRHWTAADRAPFAALNADPEVTRWLPAPLTPAESDALADRLDADLTRQGWGVWAIEERASAAFLGFTGLARPAFDAAFAPAVEVGWRLARAAWGNGFATEAGRAAVAFAFDELALGEIVSFTAVGNARSRAVMERLGMRHDAAGDFDHPRVSDERLRRHVLYRLPASDRPLKQRRPTGQAGLRQGGGEVAQGSYRQPQAET
jgi:RimJ/RimL family protein N-acetyltransferase